MDIIGSAGIITVTNVGGVTLALHTIMLQPGRENEQVLVDARTLKACGWLQCCCCVLH